MIVFHLSEHLLMPRFLTSTKTEQYRLVKSGDTFLEIERNPLGVRNIVN